MLASGRTVLITGGCGASGSVAARALADQGAVVNDLAPGIVRVGMTLMQWNEEPCYRARASRAIPLGLLQTRLAGRPIASERGIVEQVVSEGLDPYLRPDDSGKKGTR